MGTEDCCNTAGFQRGGGGGGSITTALTSLDTRFKDAREYEKKRAEATAEKPVVRDQRHEAILIDVHQLRMESAAEMSIANRAKNLTFSFKKTALDETSPPPESIAAK